MSEVVDPAEAERREREVREFTEKVISWFNQAYYFDRQRTWCSTYWMGVNVHKCPTDLWVYQEIIFETKPTLIIETGTANGGSALFLAQIGGMVSGVRVVTVDVNNEAGVGRLPQHAAISYASGSSTDARVVEQICGHVRQGDRVMVILDSDHAQKHVSAEMEVYGPLVTPGCYMIVEDTNVNGHPVYPLHGPGPMEAVMSFLPAHPEFEAERKWEKFMLTFNPSGYLRRKA